MTGAARSLTEHLGATRGVHGIPNVNDLLQTYDKLNRWQATAGATVGQTMGFASALTVRGTASNADDGGGQFIGYATATTLNTNSGLNTPALWRTTWIPNVAMLLKFGPTVVTQRIWAGLFSADPYNSATAPAHTAAFRFDTGAGDTRIQAVTKDATTATLADTGITPVIDGRISLGIEAEGVVGSEPTRWHFYVNRVRVHTATATLPVSATTNLALYITIANLSAGTARTIRVGNITVATQA
jgi:hypothetical protein